MEIILKETIDTLGREGDIVKVKPGYARNYLIPQKKAVMVTKSNLAVLKQEQEAIKTRLAKQKDAAEQLGANLKDVTIEIAKKVGEENRLFGSVTSADIAGALEARGVNIDRRNIVLSEPIKTIGEFLIPIKVGYQMSVSIKLQVVSEVIGDQA